MTTGAKLRAVRKAQHLTLQNVAEKLGVTHQAIQQIETGKTVPRLETLVALADLYKISLDDVTIDTSTNVGTISARARKVPLLDFCDVAGRNFIAKEGAQMVETTSRVSGDSFALKVSGDSMVSRSGYPSFPEGTLIVVDPTIEPKSGDFVIARVQHGATFKRLEIDGGVAYLRPLNDGYPVQTLASISDVIGVVRQAIIDL